MDCHSSCVGDDSPAFLLQYLCSLFHHYPSGSRLAVVPRSNHLSEGLFAGAACTTDPSGQFVDTTDPSGQLVAVMADSRHGEHGKTGRFVTPALSALRYQASSRLEETKTGTLRFDGRASELRAWKFRTELLVKVSLADPESKVK